MFKSALESLDSCHGPYSQLNSFRNSNVFSCFLKFCTLSAALMLMMLTDAIRHKPKSPEQNTLMGQRQTSVNVETLGLLMCSLTTALKVGVGKYVVTFNGQLLQ